MRYFLIVLLALLSGCSALHSIPSTDYTKIDTASVTALPPDNVVRIAFDQNGAIYPYSDDRQLPEYETYFFDSFWSSSFTLDEYYTDINKPYTDADKAAMYQKVTKTIDEVMKANETDELIILIHGFNNSFYKASTGFYTQMREMIDNHEEINRTYLEVYWDALYLPHNLIPSIMYWFDATTYSNMAGNVGLRKVLNGLKSKVKVNMVTHSRGAAVAFSAISDPLLCENKPKVCDIKFYEQPDPNIDLSNISQLRIASIAPAVGKGHEIAELKKSGPSDFTLTVGFNKNDTVLKKRFLGIDMGYDSLLDSRLGGDIAYYNEKLSEVNSDGLFMSKVDYVQRFHSPDNYLMDKDRTLCLLWHSAILKSKPIPSHEPGAFVCPDTL